MSIFFRLGWFNHQLAYLGRAEAGALVHIYLDGTAGGPKMIPGEGCCDVCLLK